MYDRILLLILCCLVPLAALAATLFFGVPVWSTVLVALFVLAPLGYGLLASPGRADRDAGGPHSRLP